jgi:hypothetical protein
MTPSTLPASQENLRGRREGKEGVEREGGREGGRAGTHFLFRFWIFSVSGL